MGGGPVASGNIRQVGWEDTADDIKKEQGLVLSPCSNSIVTPAPDSAPGHRHPLALAYDLEAYSSVSPQIPLPYEPGVQDSAPSSPR